MNVPRDDRRTRMSSRWWEEGRSPYEPNNPFLNTNMIWIAGFTPLVVGPPLVLLFECLVSK